MAITSTKKLVAEWFTGLLFMTAMVLAPGSSVGQAPLQRNYLSAGYQQLHFQLTASELDAWRSAQEHAFRQNIDALPDSIKAVLRAKADKVLDYPWPALPATAYLEFKDNGNRTHYEQKLGERRAALNNLVMGMLVSGDHKYLAPIVNGLWATLEESTWVLPAHIGAQKSGVGLPDPDEAIIDLFDGETAASVAAIRFMLREPLRQVSPMILRRIDYELNRRVFLPYLERNDFWWMGFADRVPNNWNPWINSNVLSSVLLAGAGADTVNLVLQKVLASTDRFVNGYGEDGGCDEGPAYWSEAGGKLIHILSTVASVSGGRLIWSDIPLLHQIGTYIYKVQIAGNYFVNFADAPARTIPSPESVYDFGEYFNDDTLRRFAAYLSRLRSSELSPNNLRDFLESATLFQKLASTSPLAPEPALSWLPELQVMTARSQAGSTKGVFVAIQGGNNGESHNHNDVGNFILYVDGRPVLVDAGVGTYTAKTFSNARYTLWNMQSQWHNCPDINGVMQQDGSQYRATGIDFSAKPGVHLSMDIAAAYPPAAAVHSWRRDFTFHPAKQELHLEEEYTLTAWKDSSRIHFLTDARITQLQDGILRFSDTTGKSLLEMSYDPSVLRIGFEEKDMDDSRLRNSWGVSLTRITCTLLKKDLKGKVSFTFRKTP